jgi:branched-chain amino acid transport system substrate-binding protein
MKSREELDLKTLQWFGAVAVAALCAMPSAQAQISDNTVRIGVLNDMSGPYKDLAGPGSVLAAQMAVEDFGGKVLGASIEIVSADHQNKPDVGSGIARKWFDVDKVDAIADVPTSSVGMTVQEVSREKQKIFLISGAASAAFTGKACSPYSIQTSDDTTALSAGTTKAVVKSGADTWFFLTADYAFGHTLQKESARIVEANGGKVLGSVAHPQNASDFSSYLLTAQASGAKAIGLASSGNDTTTAMKQAVEFGLMEKGQRLVGLNLTIAEIHSLGLQNARGVQLTESFYWDMNDQAREWSKRYFARFGKMPTREHAMAYVTILHYLRAIEAAKTDEPKAVMAMMKSTPMKFFGEQGPIREDGRFVHDLRLYEVKSPAESKYPWDYYKQVAVIPGDQAFGSLEDSECPLVKKTK